jgi:hypothetical protein
MLRRDDPGFLHEVRPSLCTAVLSDVLDELGFRDQAMPPSIRPLDDELMLASFAGTGLYREVFHADPGENPYELEMALVDDRKPDDVAVFGSCGSRRIAPWGELLSTAFRARGRSPNLSSARRGSASWAAWVSSVPCVAGRGCPSGNSFPYKVANGMRATRRRGTSVPFAIIVRHDAVGSPPRPPREIARPAGTPFA